ncbi:MAG: GntR family transcriptional regulator [Synergistales bacterium]|nr:GntR family transcriptional regulator [Synergistales bacterium]
MTRNKENSEERAYRSIVELILNYEYKPGDFLLEVDLSSRLNMSRTPVSRALARLVTEGFLERMKKKGCYIPLPTPEDAQQVFFAREAVASYVASAVALRATKNDIAHLRGVLEKEKQAFLSKNKREEAKLNEAFHLGLARLSGNKYLQSCCRNLFWRSNLYIFYFDSFYRDAEMPQLTPAQHSGILDAIEARDPELASQLMCKHIRRTYEALIKMQ